MGGKGFELRWSRQAPGALLGWMVESGRREGKKKRTEDGSDWGSDESVTVKAWVLR